MRILVTGASGLQGSTVAKELLAAGFSVRTLVRTKDAPASIKLAGLGAELFVGNWGDPASMENALAGMDGLFLHTVPWYVLAIHEHTIAANIWKAAQRANIRHVVFSSAAGADQDSGQVILTAKRRIEEDLRASGLPHTVVAPAFLMDNFLAPLWFGGIADGRFPIPLQASTRIQLTAMGDVAKMVAHIFRQPGVQVGRRIAMASDAPTCEEIAATLSRVSGRKVVHEYHPLEKADETNPQLGVLFRWMAARGHGVDIPALRHEFPGLGLRNLPQWGQTQDWSSLDAPPPVVAHDHDHAHAP